MSSGDWHRSLGDEDQSATTDKCRLLSASLWRKRPRDSPFLICCRAQGSIPCRGDPADGVELERAPITKLLTSVNCTERAAPTVAIELWRGVHVGHCKSDVRCFGQQARERPGARTSGTGLVHGTELHASCIERRPSRRSAMWQLVAPARRRKRDSGGRWQIQFSSGNLLGRQ